MVNVQLAGTEALTVEVRSISDIGVFRAAQRFLVYNASSLGRVLVVLLSAAMTLLAHDLF